MNNYSCRVWVEGIDNPIDVVIKADSVKHLQAELKSARFVSHQNDDRTIDFYPLDKIYKMKLFLPNDKEDQ